MFELRLAQSPNLPAAAAALLLRSPRLDVRQAVLGNTDCPPSLAAAFLQDRSTQTRALALDRQVAPALLARAGRPGGTDLATAAVAANRHTPPGHLADMLAATGRSATRPWVTARLLTNPATPADALADALGRLRARQVLGASPDPAVVVDWVARFCAAHPELVHRLPGLLVTEGSWRPARVFAEALLAEPALPAEAVTSLAGFASPFELAARRSFDRGGFPPRSMQARLLLRSPDPAVALRGLRPRPGLRVPAVDVDSVLVRVPPADLVPATTGLGRSAHPQLAPPASTLARYRREQLWAHRGCGADRDAAHLDPAGDPAARLGADGQLAGLCERYRAQAWLVAHVTDDQDWAALLPLAGSWSGPVGELADTIALLRA